MSVSDWLRVGFDFECPSPAPKVLDVCFRLAESAAQDVGRAATSGCASIPPAAWGRLSWRLSVQAGGAGPARRLPSGRGPAVHHGQPAPQRCSPRHPGLDLHTHAAAGGHAAQPDAQLHPASGHHQQRAAGRGRVGLHRHDLSAGPWPQREQHQVNCCRCLWGAEQPASAELVLQPHCWPGVRAGPAGQSAALGRQLQLHWRASAHHLPDAVQSQLPASGRQQVSQSQAGPLPAPGLSLRAQGPRLRHFFRQRGFLFSHRQDQSSGLGQQPSEQLPQFHSFQWTATAEASLYWWQPTAQAAFQSVCWPQSAHAVSCSQPHQHNPYQRLDWTDCGRPGPLGKQTAGTERRVIAAHSTPLSNTECCQQSHPCPSPTYLWWSATSRDAEHLRLFPHQSASGDVQPPVQPEEAGRILEPPAEHFCRPDQDLQQTGSGEPAAELVALRLSHHPIQRLAEVIPVAPQALLPSWATLQRLLRPQVFFTRPAGWEADLQPGRFRSGEMQCGCSQGGTSSAYPDQHRVSMFALFSGDAARHHVPVAKRPHKEEAQTYRFSEKEKGRQSWWGWGGEWKNWSLRGLWQWVSERVAPQFCVPQLLWQDGDRPETVGANVAFPSSPLRIAGHAPAARQCLLLQPLFVRDQSQQSQHCCGYWVHCVKRPITTVTSRYSCGYWVHCVALIACKTSRSVVVSTESTVWPWWPVWPVTPVTVLCCGYRVCCVIPSEETRHSIVVGTESTVWSQMKRPVTALLWVLSPLCDPKWRDQSQHCCGCWVHCVIPSEETSHSIVVDAESTVWSQVKRPVTALLWVLSPLCDPKWRDQSQHCCGCWVHCVIPSEETSHSIVVGIVYCVIPCKEPSHNSYSIMLWVSCLSTVTLTA